jgi:glutamate 5-kinase
MRSEILAKAERIVIKIGSSSLTGRDGDRLERSEIDALVDLVASLRKRGKEVLIVSSGAIAAGLSPLNLNKRPRDLVLQQAVASVGQGLLIHHYAQSLERHNLIASQVLLTVDDVVRRSHYRNVRSTLEKLLELGVVPVINENDSVGVEEIRFGDNDRLAALTSHLVSADLLVIISDVSSLFDKPPSESGASAITMVEDFSQLDKLNITGSDSKVGSGGMITKVEAARIAASAGVSTLLTNMQLVSAALLGEEVGTLFLATGEKLNSRELWLAHAAKARGRLFLDPGAVKAICEGQRSLLPAGVTRVEGEFAAGETVELLSESGEVIARGLVAFDSEEIPQLLGRSTKELGQTLGLEYELELVHRDDLVLL